MAINGWSESGKYVLEKLEDLDRSSQEVRTDVKKLLQEVARLKVKSGVWGFIGGAIPPLVTVIIWIIARGG